MKDKKHPKAKQSSENQEKLSSKIILSAQEYKQLKEKSDTSEQHFDRLLRLQAEIENIKKRLDKERVEFIKFANVELISELIDIIDDFHLAIESVRKNHDLKLLMQGVDMITKKLEDSLKHRGLSEISEVKVAFDHDKHEAVATEATNKYPENTVVEVLRKGYKLNDKVIRPAMVKVSKNKEDEKNG